MGLEAACILITASFCMKSQTNAKYMNGGDLNMQQMDRQMNRQQKIMAAKASFQRTGDDAGFFYKRCAFWRPSCFLSYFWLHFPADFPIGVFGRNMLKNACQMKRPGTSWRSRCRSCIRMRWSRGGSFRRTLRSRSGETEEISGCTAA